MNALIVILLVIGLVLFLQMVYHILKAVFNPDLVASVIKFVSFVVIIIIAGCYFLYKWFLSLAVTIP